MLSQRKHLEEAPMENFVQDFEKQHLRYLVWFDKKTRYQVGKEKLENVTMMDLRPIFKVEDSFYKKDGSLYTWEEECEDEDNEDFNPYMRWFRYGVDVSNVTTIQALVTHRIDLETYEYEIGCYPIR
jgi:hypothetical protein